MSDKYNAISHKSHVLNFFISSYLENRPNIDSQPVPKNEIIDPGGIISNDIIMENEIYYHDPQIDNIEYQKLVSVIDKKGFMTIQEAMNDVYYRHMNDKNT